MMKAALCAILFAGISSFALGEHTHSITIDGDFSDWASVPSHYDPAGTNVHNGIPNTHDTDGDTPIIFQYM